MGANLSTILPMIHFWVVVLTCILTCIAAQPYPGDESVHAGAELVRTADHIVRHPAVDAVTVMVVGVIASLAARNFSAKKRQRQSVSCIQSAAQCA